MDGKMINSTFNKKTRAINTDIDIDSDILNCFRCYFFGCLLWLLIHTHSLGTLKVTLLYFSFLLPNLNRTQRFMIIFRCCFRCLRCDSFSFLFFSFYLLLVLLCSLFGERVIFSSYMCAPMHTTLYHIIINCVCF